LSPFRKPRPRERAIFKDWRYRNNTIAGMLTVQVSTKLAVGTPSGPGNGSIVPETFDETRQE
jgi:hypothetical protein